MRAMQRAVPAGDIPRERAADSCAAYEAAIVQAGGIENMWANVSNTAEYGGRTRGPGVLDHHTRKSMGALLKDIQSGAVGRACRPGAEKGVPNLGKGREQEPQTTA